MDAEGIYRIAGGPEVVAGGLVEMGYIDVSAHALDGEVRIAVEDGIMTYLRAGLGGVLNGELLDEGGVVRSVVLGEVAHVGSELHAQHLGDVEDDVGVGVEADGGQGQHILVRAGLPCHLVVPVEDSQFQILAQGGAEYLDAAALLAHFDIAGVGAAVGGEWRQHGGEMGVVRDVLHAEAQAGLGAVDGELAFDACARLLAEVVVPEVAGAVEMAEIEGGVDVLEEGVGLEVYGVLAQPEIEIGIAVDIQVADILANEPEFSTCAVVEGAAFALRDLASDREVALVVAVEEVEGVGGQGRGQVEVAQLVGAEEGDARLGPFVEAFAQLHAQGVFHAECLGLVAETGVGRTQVGVVGEIGGGQAAAVDIVAVEQTVDVQGVDETRHGDKLLRGYLLALPLVAQGVDGEVQPEGVGLNHLPEAV